LAVKLPALFGFPLSPQEKVPPFYVRNASLFVLPLLTVYFLWKRGLGVASGLWLALPFAAGAVFANIFPFRTGSDTERLTALHLPIALWLAVGFAYVRGRWFADGGRMNFVRFSGELAIYYVLIALGGGVLTGFTFMMFAAIDMKADWFVAGWLIPCGAAGAVIIGSWLVEAKQSVIENMAPVGNAQVVKALVPLSEMFGYATDLRSMSQGRADFTMQFDRYEEVPGNIAAEITEQSTGSSKQ